MASFARQTAVPCTLAELREGLWVQNDGLIPSGIKTSRGMISRTSIIGVVIEKNPTTFSIEDGTTNMSVRAFEPKPVYANIGDVVLVIGRPREYNGERYITLEICKKLRNHSWISYRKKELSRSLPLNFEVPVIAPVVETAQVAKNPFELLVDTIRSLDKGTGADIEEVLLAVNVPENAKFLRTLIEEGEIFEIRPGRLKVLE